MGVSLDSGTPQIQCIVPAGCGPGSVLDLQVDGKPLQVVVPPGMWPGMKINVEVPGRSNGRERVIGIAPHTQLMRVVIPEGCGPGYILQLTGDSN